MDGSGVGLGLCSMQWMKGLSTYCIHKTGGGGGHNGQMRKFLAPEYFAQVKSN